MIGLAPQQLAFCQKHPLDGLLARWRVVFEDVDAAQ